MQVSFCALARLQISFPMLPLFCPCFLQFLSNSFLLPYLLIRGTPQRMCIIPVRRCKPFMSWEDMLARVLPVSFSLYDTCINFSFPDKSSISFYLNPPPPCFYIPYPHFYLSLSSRFREPQTSAGNAAIGLCLDDVKYNINWSRFKTKYKKYNFYRRCCSDCATVVCDFLFNWHKDFN